MSKWLPSRHMTTAPGAPPPRHGNPRSWPWDTLLGAVKYVRSLGPDLERSWNDHRLTKPYREQQADPSTHSYRFLCDWLEAVFHTRGGSPLPAGLRQKSA